MEPKGMEVKNRWIKIMAQRKKDQEKLKKDAIKAGAEAKKRISKRAGYKKLTPKQRGSLAGLVKKMTIYDTIDQYYESGKEK